VEFLKKIGLGVELEDGNNIPAPKILVALSIGDLQKNCPSRYYSDG